MPITLLNEFKRKGIHLFALVIPLGYYLLPKFPSLLILIPFALGSILMDIIRINDLPLAKFIQRVLTPVLRDHESSNLTGASYILSASTICIFFFDKSVALAAIAFIILGDICAALIGRTYGKIKIGKKSLEGSLAFFSVCVLVSLVIPGLAFWVGVIGAFIAALVEAIPFPIDDNLTVPVISGLIMEILLTI